ncbi:MAG TPA: c-type cytochrome biogenesis protein CcmI [Chromatiales bacterium]|nr:c-type cytochrome biogenesis protein CcmI [Chromatiales bacterium]
MILFWAILALMVLAALAFVVPPLLGRGSVVGPQRAGVHRVLFRKRLAELETDLADGALSSGQFDQARADLERDALEALESADADAARPARRPRARWATALVVAVAIPVLAGLLYRHYGGWALLSPQTRARLAAEAVAQGDTDPALIRDMVAGLAARMRRRPNDLQGWIRLGRSYRTLKEFEQAAQAYAHAYRLAKGKDAAVIADYAEALALSRDNRLAGRPAQLVREALAVDPRQPKALWLAGWAAYQGGDYQGAAAPWKRLAAQAPRGSDVARILNREVARAEAMARGAAPAPVATTPGAGKGVTVQVSLAPRFAARTRPDETVFIFARAARGPPTPLAVVRRRVRDLPVTVTLDDSQSMMPGRTISKQREVVIGARISRSGNPLPAKGDLQGLSAPVASGGKGLVRLTIDQVVP